MDILTRIVTEKRTELNLKKVQKPIDRLESELTNSTTLSLSKSLSTNKPGIISEFKRRSPSKPIINTNAHVSEIVKDYNMYGAAGISVLTNEKFFGGNLQDLKKASEISQVPVLRKEFIIDVYQIAEAKLFGADAILLIAAILSRVEIDMFCYYAHELGLEVLLEIHNEDELSKISDKVDIIGVNNRNLKTFTTNIQYSLDIYDKLPTGKPKISESGLSNPNDIRKLIGCGYNGFLIGEHFMKQASPGHALDDLIKAVNDEN